MSNNFMHWEILLSNTAYMQSRLEVCKTEVALSFHNM